MTKLLFPNPISDLLYGSLVIYVSHSIKNPAVVLK
jgi:hypothetical protein